MHSKFYLLFVFLLVVSGSISAQQKILFDATKAETASNADWVIDADQFNLSYKNGYPVAGSGRESNAQRFPTPSQKNITASTKGTYWTGGISSWGVDMVKKGFEVETLPYNGKITYGNANNPQDLSHYAVFVVDEPNIRFTDAEKTAILQFVYQGGGLFMISDHDRSDRNGDGIDSPSVWNDLMNNNSMQSDPFGFSFDLLKFDDKSTNVKHLPGNPVLDGPMGKVTALWFFAGTSMTLHPSDNSRVEGLIYRSGSSQGNRNVLFAISVFGKGRIAALGDSSPADDGTGDRNDHLYDGWIKDANGNHQRLIVNATFWLAGSLTAVENHPDKKKEVSVSFQKSDAGCTVKVGAFPAGVARINFSVYDLSGRRLAVFQDVSSGSRLKVPVSGRGVFIYRLSANSFSQTGKFML